MAKIKFNLIDFLQGKGSTTNNNEVPMETDNEQVVENQATNTDTPSENEEVTVRRKQVKIAAWESYEAVRLASSYFNSLNEFYYVFKGAATSANKHNWGGEFPWLITTSTKYLNSRKWTIDSCKIGASLSKDEKEFKENYPDGHDYAVNTGIISTLEFGTVKPLTREDTVRINELVNEINSLDAVKKTISETKAKKKAAKAAKSSTNTRSEITVEDASSPIVSSDYTTLNIITANKLPTFNNEKEKERFAEMKNAVNTQKTYLSFFSAYRRMGYEALLMGWLPYLGLNKNIEKHTVKNCLFTASTCRTMEEFITDHNELYEYAVEHGAKEKLEDVIGTLFKEAEEYISKYGKNSIVRDCCPDYIYLEKNDNDKLKGLHKYIKGVKEHYDLLSSEKAQAILKQIERLYEVTEEKERLEGEILNEIEEIGGYKVFINAVKAVGDERFKNMFDTYEFMSKKYKFVHLKDSKVIVNKT